MVSDINYRFVVVREVCQTRMVGLLNDVFNYVNEKVVIHHAGIVVP